MSASKRPDPPTIAQSRRATKKAKFKTIETPDRIPQNSVVREVDRMSLTSSDKGHVIFKSTRRSIYLTPDDLFSDSALENITNDALETIMQDLPVDEAENAEETVSAKQKRERVEQRASNKVREWIPLRAQTLEELLLYEYGPADITEDLLCPRCRTNKAAEWTGKTYVRASLRDQGLVVQLGHNGSECPNPSQKTRRLVVVDITGIHEVDVRFCECMCPNTRKYEREWVQVFRRGWFPATTHKPATAFTLRLLEAFHETNFQGKISLYDYWRSLERITDNSGTRPTLNRYKQFSHVVRLWRHLVMLKRAGRAHDPAGIEMTEPGSLAVECPACPHPGKNLPVGWESAPAGIRWLYTLFLMLDANFRAKCKARGLDDYELGPGWSYFVEETKYQAHLKRHGAQKEQDNQCSAEHSAIVNVNVKRDGYIASGVGAVLCARHALVRKNGVGDTQNGEKYANMDYLFFSTLIGVIIIILLVSYDIACQWNRNLLSRMASFPVDMWIDLSRTTLRFAIPKKHFRVHGANHSRYSFNFLPFVGRTYGEGIESHWSHMNPVALSAREMSPGVRHEHLNDHWGTSFLKALHEARTMHAKQRRAFQEYSTTFGESVLAQWESMVKTWEGDMSKPDPYEEPTTRLSQNAVRRQLATEEAAEKEAGILPVGLELEEQQRVLGLIKVSPNSDKSAAEFQEKQMVIKRRINLWQAIQDIHMPQVAPLRAGTAAVPSSPQSPSPTLSAPSTTTSTSSMSASSTSSGTLPEASVMPTTPAKAEDIKLFLPSALPASLQKLDSLTSLCEKERRLRLAQLSDALEDIRRLRRVLTGITEFKRLNVSNAGQRANTRIRGLYARFEAKLRRSVLRYRAARLAMEALDASGEWAQRFKELRDEDISGPGREDEASEGRHTMSWIWLASPGPSSESPTNEMNPGEFAESMRVEWMRFRARVERWGEEEQLLVEEMRRVLEYFEHKARWWREQSGRRADVPVKLERALAVYAEKQALVFDGLRTHCASLWVPYLKQLGSLPVWAQPFADHKTAQQRRNMILRQIPMSLLQDESSMSSSSDADSSSDSESDSDGDE
ncbi:hypothetical protein OH76DRAFT_1423890 [Lentinus brumalis]|uniref:CxC2-like cysteine cluster KDZ transposase-associated domain-containing protein n=1 Tax=Lentinus brumalis TaxID=2498619 RepID=A0A371CIN0_9APHY|nr:hypothetical protein OH76DRAFT_1423890 [Polyporus brumalis]